MALDHTKRTSLNPKANTFRSVKRATQGNARRQDLRVHKHHVPSIQKDDELSPPSIVTVIGASSSGKSSVISSLLRHYVKSSVKNIKGPVTVVTGKTRRFTFIEYNNDVYSMVDLAKICDLAIIVVNAKVGLQMDIFEFFSMLKVHGFPKVLAVITNLDGFKDDKKLKIFKKKLKKRFWEDVYPGVKLFYMTKFKYNYYGNNEIIKLARYISLTRTADITFRSSHAYVLCDRIEDVTNQEDVNRDTLSDRTVCFYGYVQGTSLRSDSFVHIMGLGDYKIDKITVLLDPCPLSTKNTSKHLTYREKSVYAPFSSINNILFDNESVFIDLGTSHHLDKKIELDLKEVDNEFVASLLETKESIREKLKNSDIQLVEGEDEGKLQPSKDIIRENSASEVAKVVDSERIVKSHQDVILHLPSTVLRNVIYDRFVDILHNDSNEESLIGGIFYQKRNYRRDNFSLFGNDCTRNCSIRENNSNRFLNVDMISNKQKFFVTGGINESEDVDVVNDSGYTKLEVSVKDSDDKIVNENVYEENVELINSSNSREVLHDEKYLHQLKQRLLLQSQINKDEFKNLSPDERLLYEGYRPGMYVKIQIRDISAEFCDNFNPSYPVILGALHSNELQFGYLNFKILKHKWYKKVLKNNDPVILSSGWRRFQTIACLSTQDHNLRQRALKYTPAHMHCYCTCFGPLISPGSGVFTLKVSSRESIRQFLISTTGVSIDMDQCSTIVKKLRLVGTPEKIFRNTAFIKGMFSNSLEVTKFEGALLRTVSGIRGYLKKALENNNGSFRATFEDKILMSDIVFLRTWVQVECTKYFNQMKTLCMKVEDRPYWSGMKTVGELRCHDSIPIPHKTGSDYKNIDRKKRIFAPLHISKTLIQQLPFKSKPKIVINKTGKCGDKRYIIDEPNERKKKILLNEILANSKIIGKKRETARKRKLNQIKDVN